MGNIATNINQQIECLEKRGMILDYDEAKIKEFLLDIGYYRLGFYWNPFEIDKNHNFKDGTKFSDVIKLYYLDVDLRILLLRFTSRIEINFRTKVVYYTSNKHKDSPTWFADPTVINSNFINKLDSPDPKKSRIYSNEFKRVNKVIHKHHKNHINDKYAPAWKTLEYFTFGVVLDIYRNLKNEQIRERIADSLGFKNVDKFIKYMAVVVLVRNNCAHGDILFDMRLPKSMPVMPLVTFNNNDRNSLDSCIKVINYFLGQISVNRSAELSDEIKKIFMPFKDNPILKDVVEQKSNYLF